MAQPEIFYVLNSRWPTIKAYGLQVAKTCQGLKQAGAKVRLIVPIRARHRELRGMDPFTLYGVHDRFRLIRLPSLDFTRLHLTGRVFFFVQQTLFATLAAASLVFKRGAVYSRDQFVLYLLSFVRRDIFWEVHRVPEDVGSAVYRRLLARAMGIVVITEGIRRRFLDRGIPSDKLLVVPDGVDVAEFQIPQTPFQAQEMLGLDQSKHIVMYTGQLLDWKGVDILVAAAQLLDDRFRVVIVGGTAHEIVRMKALDRSGTVRFEPFQPHDRIPLWLRAADTVVLPNKKDGAVSEFYTSPLKMFEYMAAGRRIVASDLPSIREVLNESNAILVRSDDPKALAEGIWQSAEQEDAARARVTQAFADVGQYTWDKRGRRILDFIASHYALQN